MQEIQNYLQEKSIYQKLDKSNHYMSKSIKCQKVL
jgi:hypothetical protein